MTAELVSGLMEIYFENWTKELTHREFETVKSIISKFSVDNTLKMEIMPWYCH